MAALELSQWTVEIRWTNRLYWWSAVCEREIIFDLVEQLLDQAADGDIECASGCWSKFWEGMLQDSVVEVTSPDPWVSVDRTVWQEGRVTCTQKDH